MVVETFKLVLVDKIAKHAVVNDVDSNITQLEISEDNSFVYNDIKYIVFENILSLRKHHSTFEYEDMGITEYAIIPMQSAQKFLTWMATIHEYSLEYCGIPRLSSINEALQTITSELELQVNDIAADDDLRSMFKVFLNLLNNLINEITPEQIAVIQQYSDIIRLRIDSDLTISQMLKISGKYLYDSLTYDQLMVERLSLTYPMQMLSYVLRIFLLLFSRCDIAFTDRESILIHEITAIIIDLLSDRLTTNVYIKGGNTYAAGVLQQIIRKFPTLNNVNDMDKIGVFLHNNTGFEQYVRNTYPEFNLWPFILSINMPIQQRVLFNIKICLDNLNLRNEKKIEINPNEVIQLIYDICKPYIQTNQYERYNESCFKQIINSVLFSKICTYLNFS